MAEYSIPTTAQIIANYFLWLSNESGSFLSNLKLQKLLYYAQGWHLGLGKGRLFKDQMQAWVHGPTIPSIYGRYKKFSYQPIAENVGKPELPPKTEQFLKGFAKVFFPLDAFYLELATHKESAWLNARGNLPPDAPCKRPINEGDMLAHFVNMAKKGAKN
jgi:uncharacterized phage-associated protein